MIPKITASQFLVDTNWAYAYGIPTIFGNIRSSPQDFLVREAFDVKPTGSGEHVLLKISKTSLTTNEVARAIARHAKVKLSNVGFAGMKDRNAVCEQWFSVHLVGKTEPDWSTLQTDKLRILLASRHARKLNRGSHKGNAFEIVLRDLEGDRRQFIERLQTIKQSGVPNYYGEQRFVYEGKNVELAIKMFSGEIKVRDRYRRGIYLSAARSFLFNKVLANRIEADSWNRLLQGDVANLDGSRSQFSVDESTEELVERQGVLDIHPTGPLWGRGRLASHASVLELEHAVTGDFEAICAGLEQAGLKQERRPLRLRVTNLEYEWIGNDALQLKFSLQRGAYATSVLRESLGYARRDSHL